VAVLGAAQFALPGAVDRLRAARPAGDAAAPLVLAATDPSQPYGAALPWPPSGGRPARAAGALVVLIDGEAVAFVERGGRSVWTFPAAADHPAWPAALAARVTTGRARSHEVHSVDGEPVRTTPWADALRAAGYADGYRGLVIRAR
jgi:ATP-dependent Lhr-like helicase